MKKSLLKLRKLIPVILLVCLVIIVSLVYTSSFALKPVEFSLRATKDSVLVFPSENYSENASIQTPEDMELITQKGHLVLFANLKNGMLALGDLRDGSLWRSSPESAEEDPLAKGAVKFEMMSIITVTDIVTETNIMKKRNSHIGSFQKKGIKLKKTKDGFEGTIEFPGEGYTIPIKVALLEDSLIAEIDTKEIIEENEGTTIYQIGLLPFFAAQDDKEEGFLILPDGSGSIINFNNGKGRMNYRVPLYGEDLMVPKESQSTTLQRASVPYFAISASKKALFAIVEEGATVANLFASPAGGQTSQNQVSCEFDLRSYHNVTLGTGWNARDVAMYEETKPRTETFRVRYFPAAKQQQGIAGLSGMLRDYLEKAEGVVRTDNTNNPIFISTPAGIRTTKSILGVPTAVSNSLMTYAKLSELVKDLNGEGIDNLLIRLEGWSDNGLKGGITSKFDPIRNLGSKKELTKLLDALKEHDGKLYLLPQNVLFNRSLGGVSLKFDHTKNLSLSPVEIRTFKRNTFFEDPRGTRKRLLVAPLAISSFMKLFEDIPDNQSLSLSLGSLGTALYTEGSKDSNDRTGMADMIKQMEIPKTLSENANMYALRFAESVMDLPNSGSGFDVSDGSIPFLAIALRDLIPCSLTPINDSGSWTDAFLQSLSAGTSLHYRILMDPPANIKDSGLTNYYAADYEKLKPTIINQYKQIEEFYKDISGSSIVEYKVQSDGLIITKYDNEKYSVINLTTEDLIWEGTKIMAKSYITGGSKK